MGSAVAGWLGWRRENFAPEVFCRPSRTGRPLPMQCQAAPRATAAKAYACAQLEPDVESDTSSSWSNTTKCKRTDQAALNARRLRNACWDAQRLLAARSSETHETNAHETQGLRDEPTASHCNAGLNQKQQLGGSRPLTEVKVSLVSGINQTNHSTS